MIEWSVVTLPPLYVLLIVNLLNTILAPLILCVAFVEVLPFKVTSTALVVLAPAILNIPVVVVVMLPPILKTWFTVLVILLVLIAPPVATDTPFVTFKVTGVATLGKLRIPAALIASVFKVPVYASV